MRYRNPESIVMWLQSGPPLQAMKERFPEDWNVVRDRLKAIMESGEAEQLKAWTDQLQSTGGRPSHLLQAMTRAQRDARVGDLIRGRMLAECVKAQSLAMVVGSSGRFRLNLWNGFLAQRLLFHHDFVRKPVSLRWFRFLWPCLTQRRLIMPLVEQKGIYCFYSKELIAALVKLIDGASCLEIGAGDGTLSRFLLEGGANIVATDNRSWGHAISYPDHVVDCDAVRALKLYAPTVVLCSWPPPNNGFERFIFETPSVQTYVFIGSRLQFASGDWRAYAGQRHFIMTENAQLSAMVLPPDLQPIVCVFTRREPADRMQRVPY